jgi:uncharacterized protein YodC (DUF2158 family)
MTTAEAGAIVKLKSGGPAMTVQGPANSFANAVICQWFDPEAKLQQGEFTPEQLQTSSASGQRSTWGG